jgi:hypothetical protein
MRQFPHGTPWTADQDGQIRDCQGRSIDGIEGFCLPEEKELQEFIVDSVNERAKMMFHPWRPTRKRPKL